MRFEVEKTGDIGGKIEALFLSFPELSARVLGFIGKQATKQLYEEHLQGQDIEFHNVTRSGSGLPRSKSGRRLAGYSIGRGLKWVAVSSFPLNLYEKRRQLRSGDSERRGILTKKLEGGLSGRMSNYIAEADNLIVDEWFNSSKKGGIKTI